MTKKELINSCIDMSYNVSYDEMEKAIFEVIGERYMQTKHSIKAWKELHDKLSNILNQKNGSVALFAGSNAEHYRQ